MTGRRLRQCPSLHYISGTSTKTTISMDTAPSLKEHLQRAMTATSMEKARVQVEADRLRTKVARLREQANEVEEQVKRLCRQSNDCERMRESLEFDVLCLALRSNDADTTKVPGNIVKYPAGYAALLGDALQGNTHVSHIDIEVAKLMPAFYDAQQMETIIDPLLRYVGTSASLRSILMGANHPDSALNAHLHTALFEAVFKSQEHISELTCYSSVPAFPFSIGMRNDTLKNLDVDFGHSSAYSQREQVAIASAFRSSASLEVLRLGAEDPELATAILVALRDGMATNRYVLHDLSLRCHGGDDVGYWNALTDMAHNAAYLTNLQVEREEFDEMGMGAFLPCLMSPSTISKLSFEECHINQGAMRLLKRFMVTRKEGETLNISSLCDLVFDSDTTLEGWSGKQFASMFRLKREQTDDAKKWYSTIGSGVTSLSFRLYLKGCSGFLKAWTSRPHCMKLARLEIGYVDETECLDLIRFLPKVLSLQELVISDFDDNNLIHIGLRSNGTLLSVSIPGEIESRLANSFCLRNKLLGPLLQELAEAEWDERPENTDCMDGSNANNEKRTFALSDSVASGKANLRCSFVQCAV
jgi:hypothetical protein